jgi:hypothetical protein
VNPLDELSSVLPRPPASQELPRQQRHKAELLTIIAADRPRRLTRHRAIRGWLGPALAATAVAAVAVLAVLVSNLAGGAGSGSPAAHPGLRTGQPGPAPAGPPTDRLTVIRSWSVPAAQFGTVVVSVNRGSVTIEAGDASAAAIVATPDYRGKAPLITSRVRNKTLAVTARCPQEPRCAVGLTLKLPAGVAVQAESDVGDVRVTGLGGNVAASSQQGQVSLTDVTGRIAASDQLGNVTLTDVGGTITAITAEGTISAASLSAAQVTLSSQDGDITADFAVSPARVTASSQLGDVTLRLPGTVTYDVDASTQLGDTSVTVPRSATAQHIVKASSELGSVTVAPASPGPR